MITTHRFDSTGDAYDASQTDDAIKDGDVLVVESERVVGILVKAWPTAVTTERGAFHTLADDASWEAFGARDARTDTYWVHPRDGEPYEHTETIPAVPATDYSASVDVARAIAVELGIEPGHTETPRTPEGEALLDAFAVGDLVEFEFMPDPDMPQGLSGVGAVLGVVEQVSDEGTAESGPRLSVYVALVIEHEGETYTCHPEDGTTRLRLA